MKEPKTGRPIHRSGAALVANKCSFISLELHLESLGEALSRLFLHWKPMKLDLSFFLPFRCFTTITMPAPFQNVMLGLLCRNLQIIFFQPESSTEKMREMDTEQWASLNIRWISEIKWPSENVFSRNKIFITLTKDKNTFFGCALRKHLLDPFWRASQWISWWSFRDSTISWAYFEHNWEILGIPLACL